MTTLPALTFVKGHGTQNDFVILPDPYAQIELTAELTAALCDRRRGVGADGVLRVATAGALVAEGVLERLPDGVSGVDLFMDYRNADGSIAEMCGNGVRVFAHFCRSAELVESDRFTVGSRAGGRPVTIHYADGVDADVSVAMGRVQCTGESSARIVGRRMTGDVIDVGNPHLACVVDGLTTADLRALDLTAAPEIDAAVFPHGANVEIVTPVAHDDRDGVDFHAAMRVYERGVGETRSCGTGLVAAATAALSRAGRSDGVVALSVPGGNATVSVADGEATLRGPSRLVARGELFPGWAQ